MTSEHFKALIRSGASKITSFFHKMRALALLLWEDINRFGAGATPPPMVSPVFCRWTALLVTSFLGGLFLANTFLDPMPQTYRPNFGSAQWIQVQKKPIVVGYFQQVIEVSPPLSSAWIAVAAPDSYSLYINGKLVETPVFVGKAVTGIYDLRPLLVPGKNVIAIKNEISMSPGTAKVIVRGAWTDLHRTHEIVSDQRWKASVLSEDQPGKTPWTKITELKGSWHPAIASGKPRIGDCIETGLVDPHVFETNRRGLWIGALNPGIKDIVFRGTFYRWKPSSPNWMRLVASGSFYDLRVNGRLIADHLQSTNQTDVREIGRFCHLGPNEIEVRVHADKGVPALNVDGWSEGFWGHSFWQTSSSWKAFASGRSIEQPIQIFGRYGQMPWGFASIPTSPLPPRAVPGDDLDHIIRWSLSFLIIFAALFLRWQKSDQGLISLSEWSHSKPLRTYAIAMTHLPVILFMTAAWLLTFDARLSRDCFFQPWFFVVVGMVWWIPQRLLINPHRFPARLFERLPSWKSRLIGGFISKISSSPRHCLKFGILVVILGFIIRMAGITDVSLDHDEVQQINFSHSILRCGVPYWQAGSFTKFCSTYELLSYVLALSRLFFGVNDFAYRLPAVLFGTGSIMLTGIIGYRCSGPKTGLLAALVYALFPAAIGWSQNSFYPSQVQFFSLLTVWIFYEAMRAAPFHPRLLILASTFMLITYLSWEASGFLLVAIPAGFLAMHGLRFFWVKDWNFWRCLYVVCFVVGIQLCYRKMTMVKYLGVGVSLNDITTPGLVFLSPMDYDPWFYFRCCFFQENFVIPTLLIMLFPFYLRDRGLRYLATVTFVMLLCFTNLLKVYAFRYTYMYQPLLLILASALIVRLCTHLRQMADNAGPKLRLEGVRVVACVVVLFLLSTNGFILKLYDASYTPATPSEKCRLGFYKIDYRGASEFVKKHYHPQDTIVAASTHVFKFYNGITPEYTINTLTSSRILFDGSTGTPRYMDVFLGSTVIRTAKEFDSIRAKGGRLWLVAAPYSVFVGSNSKEMIQYINQNAQVVYESYQIKVYFFPGPPAVLNAGL